VQEIEELTGTPSWKLVIVKESPGGVKVAIQGPRGGEKAWVRITAADLREAVNKELS